MNPSVCERGTAHAQTDSSGHSGGWLPHAGGSSGSGSGGGGGGSAGGHAAIVVLSCIVGVTISMLLAAAAFANRGAIARAWPAVGASQRIFVLRCWTTTQQCTDEARVADCYCDPPLHWVVGCLLSRGRRVHHPETSHTAARLQVQHTLGGAFRRGSASRGVNYADLDLDDLEDGGDMAPEFLAAAPGRTAGQYSRLPGANGGNGN